MKSSPPCCPLEPLVECMGGGRGYAPLQVGVLVPTPCCGSIPALTLSVGVRVLAPAVGPPSPCKWAAGHWAPSAAEDAAWSVMDPAHCPGGCPALGSGEAGGPSPELPSSPKGSSRPRPFCLIQYCDKRMPEGGGGGNEIRRVRTCPRHPGDCRWVPAPARTVGPGKKDSLS